MLPFSFLCWVTMGLLNWQNNFLQKKLNNWLLNFGKGSAAINRTDQEFLIEDCKQYTLLKNVTVNTGVF